MDDIFVALHPKPIASCFWNMALFSRLDGNEDLAARGGLDLDWGYIGPDDTVSWRQTAPHHDNLPM